MRVLITGGGGFLGRHCLPGLIESAKEVHALVRPGSAFCRPGVCRQEADLFDTEAVTSVVARVRPTHLLHLAWVTEPTVYWTSVANVRWVEASLALLRAFAEHGGTRAVLTGTCAEYDWSEGVCREATTPLRPSSLYGICKDALRSVALGMAAQLRLQLAWGRVFFLYGPHEHPSKLVASVISRLLGKEPALCSAGAQRRDFLHVRDAADALVALLRSRVCGAVNVGSGEPTAVADLARLIAEEVGEPGLLRLGALPARGEEPPLVAADVRRLREELGWAPRLSLRAGLRDTIAWWRSRAG